MNGKVKMIDLRQSPDQLLDSFKKSIIHLSEDDIDEAMEDEIAGENRPKVVKILRRTLRLKQLGAEHI